MKRAYFVGAYYLSWVMFGLVGLILNLGCALLLLLPRSSARERQVRAVIKGLFSWWLQWLHMTRVVEVRWHGFDGVELSGGTVYVANHLTLVDAPFLLARLPEAICIFKPALMRNPAVGPAAIAAGYVSGQTGVDVVREVSDHIRTGGSLLIFPEGTRTGRGQRVGMFKPGFALIAERARAPVRLVSIRSTGGLCTREDPWWQAPAVLPARIDLTLEREWLPAESRRPAELTALVQQEIETRLTADV